jgi:hypothetical protein
MQTIYPNLDSLAFALFTTGGRGMADLSPAVQEVVNAHHNVLCSDEPNYEAAIAAAFRAAAKRSSDLLGDVCHPKYREGVEASADFLEHIATELENHA